jgi:hypothetical protein
VVGAIAFFSTGSPSTQQTSAPSCTTESASLLGGSFTPSQRVPYAYTVTVRNSQTQTVRLMSYTLGTQSHSIDLAIAAGQNGTFTTVQDADSETWIPVKTSCGNQIMTAWASGETYLESIAPTSVAFEDSTHVALDLQNNGTGTATLATFSVTDSSGNVYTLANWSGPSLAPNSVTTTTFSIGSSCFQCTLQGSAFTFTSGHQYTIQVATGRGNIFTFTVTWIPGHHYSIELQIGLGSTAH